MSEEQDKKDAALKLEWMQREYWRLNNGKQRYMRCPYCSPLDSKVKRRNYFGAPKFCCDFFGKALKAILDRQDEVDKGMNAARNIQRIMKMVEN